MKRCFVTLVVLLSSFLLLAMSGSPKEDPKKTELLGPKVEIQSGDGFITLDELHRIAINFYKYIFEEEHEFRGWIKKNGEIIIKNITPFKEDGIILAYMVNFNPDGHVLIKANKSTGTPIDQNGSGTWKIGVEEGFVNSLDARLHPIIRDGIHRLKKALDSKTILTKDEDLKIWHKFNVPVDSFKERADYENDSYKPNWWLEKKKSKNTLGLIKTEWHQSYPYYNFCPVTSDTTVVGCSPLAMAQLMKFYNYPVKGVDSLSTRTYDLVNMPASANYSSTQAQKDAVASICRDAGASVYAEYGLTGTDVVFSNISAGLCKFFNYTANLRDSASFYSTTNTTVWQAKLKSSILLNRPVIYGGLFTDATFSGTHTWIIDQYTTTLNQFHFNLGWQDTTLNDWYPTDKILTSHYAVFDITPDNSESALHLPYRETFDSVRFGSGITQIPVNTGVSKAVSPNGFMTMYVVNYSDTTVDNTKVLKMTQTREGKYEYFVLKKIELVCDSIPVLKFKYRINDSDGVFNGSDYLAVDVSNDDRVTWTNIFTLNQSNIKTDDTQKLKEIYLSLSEYKGDVVNIRYRYSYEDINSFCFIDDIEVNSMSLSFPELANNMILPSKTTQSIKVQPSFGTPPKKEDKSINNEVLMDFYIKQDDGESEYTLSYTDSVLENGIYEFPNWDTKSSLGISFKIRAVARSYNNSSTITSSEVNVKIKCEPTIESPLPSEIFYTRPSSKGGASDTLTIKVKVPEVLGAYPEINIKIDGAYVNQGDIVFDTNENVWVYIWDLSTASPTEYGIMYIITAEMDSDSTDYGSTSIYIAESLFYEDFETMESLTAAGWAIDSWELPELPYIGWQLNVDALDPENGIALTFSQHSNDIFYLLDSPAIAIPTDQSRKTMVSYRVYYGELEAGTTFSHLNFCVCDIEGNPLFYPSIQVAAINNQWGNFTYDLSAYAGQTIKLEWYNSYYNTSVSCKYTAFCLDDVLVYTIPDMNGPEIDYISGTDVDLNEDMNLVVGFNDTSGIDGVTADYTIDGSSGSLTLTSSKSSYSYTGTILAKDHECNGTIIFKIKDSIGNETISSSYSIKWAVGGGGFLSAPENVVITAMNDSTASISWDLVVGATSYKVYSSTDPYGTFTEDTTGTFTESRVWQKAFDGNKYFYYVVAANASKNKKNITKTSSNQVK